TPPPPPPRPGLNSIGRHLSADSFALEKFDRKLRWRPPACIESVEFSSLRLVNNREKIAANPIHHRLNDAHHRIGRHRRIHSVPAASKDRSAGLRRQRTLRRHNPPPRQNHRTPLRPILPPRRRHNNRQHSHRRHHQSQHRCTIPPRPITHYPSKPRQQIHTLQKIPPMQQITAAQKFPSVGAGLR